MLGRPTKLTPELVEEVVKLIECGVPPLVAALACGISRSTFFRWKALAEQEDDDGIRILRTNGDSRCASPRTSCRDTRPSRTRRPGHREIRYGSPLLEARMRRSRSTTFSPSEVHQCLQTRKPRIRWATWRAMKRPSLAASSCRPLPHPIRSPTRSAVESSRSGQSASGRREKPTTQRPRPRRPRSRAAYSKGRRRSPHDHG